MLQNVLALFEHGPSYVHRRRGLWICQVLLQPSYVCEVELLPPVRCLDVNVSCPWSSEQCSWPLLVSVLDPLCWRLWNETFCIFVTQKKFWVEAVDDIDCTFGFRAFQSGDVRLHHSFHLLLPQALRYMSGVMTVPIFDWYAVGGMMVQSLPVSTNRVMGVPPIITFTCLGIYHFDAAASAACASRFTPGHL